MDWLEILKLAGSAVGGGAVGSLITQWSGWGVEVRRLKRQNRAQQIENWRQLIAALPVKSGWSHGDPECTALFRSPHFISLEHHLPGDLLRRLRAERTFVVGADFPRRELSELIANLEKRWDLI